MKKVHNTIDAFCGKAVNIDNFELKYYEAVKKLAEKEEIITALVQEIQKLKYGDNK